MATQKKVVKKTVLIDGKEVPYYLCPPGMSGLGVDLEKHLQQEEKEEAIFETETGSVIETVLKEDCGFLRAHQRYLEEGVTDHPEIEDYIESKMKNRYYDNESDRNRELTDIYK
jgi:hypothetical protein